MSISMPTIAQGLSLYQAPMGRMQVFNSQPRTVLNLIKNPTGCDSVLQAIASEPGNKVLCIAINDLAADGRDVSWLWDADFELTVEQGQFIHCVTTGLRAEDMALRLKYGDFPEKNLSCHVPLEEGLDVALSTAHIYGDLPVYVLSTYTALYPLAQLLARRVSVYVQATENRPSVS
jgi:UDP-N-acetylmuramyl tripeptide synthase